jgi:esterase/lipase
MRWQSALSSLGVAGLAAVLMGTGLPVRLAAQQAPQGVTPPSPGMTTSIPDATIQKAGAALRQIAQIQQDYQQHMKSAQTQEQQQGLTQQANAQAVQAVKNQGLSVDQYNQVIRVAQADPGTRQRLLAAAQQAP